MSNLQFANLDEIVEHLEGTAEEKACRKDFLNAILAAKDRYK